LPRAEFDSHPLFAGMGIEPLGNELDGALLARLFAGKSALLKAALLDQRLIAGLGNIYVCEALHRAGLSPRRAAGTLARRNGAPTEHAHRLAEVIPQVLNEAIEAGGSSLRDHRQTDGTLGYFQHRFRVYAREGEPCPTRECSGTIRRIVQSGRSTFFCRVCQR
jgi:formamidopyrimidine-DNA glycosylase